MDNEFRKILWKWDDSVVWVTPLDAFLAIELSKHIYKGLFCEIGVFKGGFLLTILRNLQGWQAIGIDPYPNMPEVREIFFSNLKNSNLESKVRLIENYDLTFPNKFDLVHIDGEHTEKAVLQDLEFARANLSPDGLIIVDDIFHQHFPGIISAVMKVIHSTDLVPFLFTRDKIYICDASKYNDFFERAKKCLSDAKIFFNTGSERGDAVLGNTATFDQPNDVKGFTQIVVERMTLEIQSKKLGIKASKQYGLLQILSQNLLPPIFAKLIKKLFRVWK